MKTRSRNLLVALGVIILLAGIYYFSSLVVYIVIAWVLSLLGAPIMRKLKKIKIKKWSMPNSLAAVLTLFVFIVVIVLFFALIFPPIIHQARNLSQIDTGALLQTLESPMSKLEEWLVYYGLMDKSVSLEAEFQQFSKNIFNPESFFNFFQSLVGTFGNLFIGLFSVVFITFFFLKDQNLFNRLITSIMPDRLEENANRAIRQSSNMLRSYFGGLMVQMVLFMLVVLLPLLFLGFKNALLIAFIAALLNVIPYLGPILGMVFGVFITISSNIGVDFYSEILPMIVYLLIIFFVAQQVDGFGIQPLVFSSSVQAHPLEIFLVVLMGGQLGGVPGMILAIPAYTVLRVIGQIFFNEYKVVRRLTQGMNADI